MSRGWFGTAVVAAVIVTSVVALPLLGGGFSGIGDGDAGTVEADGGLGSGFQEAASERANDAVEPTAVVPAELVSLEAPERTGRETAVGAGQDDGSQTDAHASLAQEDPDLADAIEAGVNDGIDVLQSQGVEVSQEQRAAALEGASESVVQHQAASVEQVQSATAGAVQGTLLQEQRVDVEQVQAAVGGATDGALGQHQVADATHLQHAAKGAAYGALEQEQRVTVEQIQVATRGAAAGAASQAGQAGVEHKSAIREAATGAAYGALEGEMALTGEQRQRVTVEQVQHAAAGGAAGTLAEKGSDADSEADQRQDADAKQIQLAAKGAAKGSLDQRQGVTVEQTQSAAWGAGAGVVKGIQSVEIEQEQRVSSGVVTAAAHGGAKGAITAGQSQEASVEQIQGAADGAAFGSLVQHQEVSITQVQHAAIGSAKGAVETAVQEQVVEIEQIQAASAGAGQGTVTQTQVVDVTQVQSLARGGASGALTQHQTATVEQIQTAALSACQETARVVQDQRISVTQLQTVTSGTAADAAGYAAAEGVTDRTEIVQRVEIEIVQRIEEIDEREGTASITFSDQESDGETVVVDDVELSEGGFVAIYDGVAAALEPTDVRGVSSYLEPGDRADLEIELDEPLEESGPLVAAVHHDTTGDETFQYVETNGLEDDPYVTERGTPVADSAVVTLDAEPAEPEATLTVSDQTGDGETLLVEEASATTQYVLSAEYDGDRSDSEPFDANESVDAFELDLDPPLEEDATVDVSVRDAGTDEVLENESLEYALEQAPTDPEATLTVSDQTGTGESVLVDEASATVPYAVVVQAPDGELIGESVPFEADETVENVSVGLDPALEENATLEVSVISMGDGDAPDGDEALPVADGQIDADDDAAAGDGEVPPEGTVLASETIEYAVEGDTFEVAFPTCQRGEISGTFGDGDSVIVGTGFYESGGYGNTMGEYGMTVGDDVSAPLEGTIVFEVGEAFDVEETDEGAFVEVPPGDFGAAITGIVSPEATPGSMDYPNPNTSDCLEEVRPELPTIDVEEIEPLENGVEGATDDAIDVTFGYENPNDAELLVDSQFVEGTVDAEPIDALEPGEGEFTVTWTPETGDERLVWAVDMDQYDYDEVLTAATPPAEEIDPTEPAEFTAEILETNSPVTQGDALTVETEIANVGGEADTQSVELAIDGDVRDATDVTLEPEESETVEMTAETDDLEPGEYPIAVATANVTAETTATIEPLEEDGEFAIVDLSGPPTAIAGQEVTLAVTLTNEGGADEQPVTYSVDGEVLAEESVALEPGAFTTLTFSSTLPPGESTHTVATDADEASTTITGLEVPGTDAADDGDGATDDGETETGVGSDDSSAGNAADTSDGTDDGVAAGSTDETDSQGDANATAG
uniref:DUF7282 domain-containing protein n=1 Tax=Halopiger goleimassiliensis TaxID=1293048 RepID=UPI0006782459